MKKQKRPKQKKIPAPLPPYKFSPRNDNSKLLVQIKFLNLFSYV